MFHLLKQIRLINFQKHSKLVLDLDELVTTIIGKSDVGKSSIIRALYWLCLGKPTGNRFVQHGKKGCRVELVFDDNVHVIKTRGATKPTVYRINQKLFKAAGTIVPHEIAELLGVSELNFQTQLSPIFWILNSPGEVAKKLNEIVDMQNIDKSLDWISAKHRACRASIAVSEDKISQLETTVGGLSWVGDLERALRPLTLIRDALNRTQEQRVNLSHLLGKANAHNSRRTALQEFLGDGHRVLKLAVRYKKTHKRTKRLGTLHSKAIGLTKRGKPDFLVATIKLDWMAELESKIRRLHDRAVRLQKLTDKANQLRWSLPDLKAAVTKLKNQLHKQLKGKKCPLCQQTIGHLPS